MGFCVETWWESEGGKNLLIFNMRDPPLPGTARAGSHLRQQLAVVTALPAASACTGFGPNSYQKKITNCPKTANRCGE